MVIILIYGDISTVNIDTCLHIFRSGGDTHDRGLLDCRRVFRSVDMNFSLIKKTFEKNATNKGLLFSILIFGW